MLVLWTLSSCVYIKGIKRLWFSYSSSMEPKLPVEMSKSPCFLLMAYKENPEASRVATYPLWWVYIPGPSKGCQMDRLLLSNPLGFKHHPLEGAGIIIIFTTFLWNTSTRPFDQSSKFLFWRTGSVSKGVHLANLRIQQWLQGLEQNPLKNQNPFDLLE